jgi:hypothetical protein
MQTKTADDYHELADGMEALATQLTDTNSISDAAPVLTELFHEARTSNRRARDGRYVALFDYDGGEWSCRSVAFLETGTHYRDTNADMTLSFKPWPFLSVDEFTEHIRAEILRQAQATRQTATGIEERKAAPHR